MDHHPPVLTARTVNLGHPDIDLLAIVEEKTNGNDTWAESGSTFNGAAATLEHWASFEDAVAHFAQLGCQTLVPRVR